MTTVTNDVFKTDIEEEDLLKAFVWLKDLLDFIEKLETGNDDDKYVKTAIEIMRVFWIEHFWEANNETNNN